MRFACFDRWDTPKPDPTGVTEAKWTSGVDSTRNLELTCMGETTIGKGDRILFADPRGNLQETIVVSPEHRREDTRIITSLVCKGSIQELDDTFIEDKRNRTATATQCLRKALEGTRWTVGTVDDDGTTADLSFYHVSALEAVESIASEYGLEITSSYLMDPQHLRITNRAVNLVKAQGDQSNEGLRRFEYGHDLKGVTRTVDATGVKTRLYGYGKGLPATDEEGNETGGYGRRIDFSDINNGKPYVEDTEATKLWGLPGPADEALGDNLTNNGDFEKGAGRADGWTFSPFLAFLDAQITGDGNIKPHAGTTMLRMGTDTDTCASKAHGDSIKAKPGVTYELSFWTLANLGETFKVSIRQGYTAYPDPTIKITPATNTGQWTRTRQRFTIDSPKEINIWIIFEKPTGTIYLDDVELRALTSTTIHPAEGIYENGDCEDKQQLLEETKAELERRSVPTVSYEADILTFARSGTDLNGVGLGDRVLLVDTTFTPRPAIGGPRAPTGRGSVRPRTDDRHDRQHHRTLHHVQPFGGAAPGARGSRIGRMEHQQPADQPERRQMGPSGPNRRGQRHPMESDRRHRQRQRRRLERHLRNGVFQASGLGCGGFHGQPAFRRMGHRRNSRHRRQAGMGCGDGHGDEEQRRLE